MNASTLSTLRLTPASLLAGLFIASAPAQTVWNNAAGGSWATAENWSAGAPDSTTDTVTLPTLTSAYTVTYAGPLGFANTDKLTLGSGATLDVNGTLAVRGAGGVIPLELSAGSVINVNNGGSLESIKSASGAPDASISGALNINGGAFKTTTSSGSGKRTVVNSGGSVVLNSGSAAFTGGNGIQLSAGSSLTVGGGTFTSTLLDWYGGASVSLSLDGDFIPLTLSGSLTRQSAAGGGYSLILTDTGVAAGTTYTLFNFASTTFSLANFTLSTPIDGYLTLNATSLTFTAVPEPSTAIAALGIIGLGFRRWWVRRRPSAIS